MPFTPEVHAFQGEIRCHQNFMSGRNPQHSGIVTNAGDYVSAPPPSSSPDACNQRLFLQRHVDQYNRVYRFCREFKACLDPADWDETGRSTWFAERSLASETELRWLPVPRSKWEPGPS
jgi:hypothetical protein